MRYLEIILLNSIIGIRVSTPSNWCSPKLSSTYYRSKKVKYIVFQIPVYHASSSSICNWCLAFFQSTVSLLWQWFCTLSGNLNLVRISTIGMIFSSPTRSFFQQVYVFLFHRKDMKRDIFKITTQCIHAPHCITGELFIDFVTFNIVQLVLTTHNDSICIDILIFISTNT